MSNTFLLLLLLVLILPLVYIIAVYNSLAKLRIRIKEAWSQIDVQLKRRSDLIPNLVETVKGYAEHEKGVFENVTKARAALMAASGVEEKQAANNMLTGALKSLFAVAEAYPELRAQEGFVNLQRELSDTEDKVSYSRQFYNNVVRQYNEMIVAFPTNILAGLLNFRSEPFFEITQAERDPVKVSF